MPSLARLVHQQSQREAREPQLCPKRIPRSAFVSITLQHIDDEGVPLRFPTWTWGIGTAGVVLARWRKQHPTLAAIEVDAAVLSDGPKPVAYLGLMPLGKRVKVADPALERAAVGL